MMRVTTALKKKLGRTALAVVFCLLAITSAFALTGENQSFSLKNNGLKMFRPSATFKAIWIDYDVTEGKRDGMRIHLKFTTYAMKGVDGYLAIYFLDEDGNKLQDTNGRFNSSAGDVAVYYPIRPNFPTTDYNDLSVFMPYSELDLDDGEYNLQIDADVIYKNGGLIDHLTFKDIVYNQG